MPRALADLQAAGQQATFRAGIDLVNFGVTVTDRKGTFIDDLDHR